jgi:dihydroxyacetone kinase
MGGSSGVLMSIFFTAAGQKLEQGKRRRALNAGLAQMKFYGGADEGDRTMIDALQPALAALLAEPDNLQAAFAAAQAGADRTASRQQSGRRARRI